MKIKNVTIVINNKILFDDVIKDHPDLGEVVSLDCDYDDLITINGCDGDCSDLINKMQMYVTIPVIDKYLMFIK